MLWRLECCCGAGASFCCVAPQLCTFMIYLLQSTCSHLQMSQQKSALIVWTGTNSSIHNTLDVKKDQQTSSLLHVWFVLPWVLETLLSIFPLRGLLLGLWLIAVNPALVSCDDLCMKVSSSSLGCLWRSSQMAMQRSFWLRVIRWGIYLATMWCMFISPVMIAWAALNLHNDRPHEQCHEQ